MKVIGVFRQVRNQVKAAMGAGIEAGQPTKP
jgi:hypothetical protein